MAVEGVVAGVGGYANLAGPAVQAGIGGIAARGSPAPDTGGGKRGAKTEAAVAIPEGGHLKRGAGRAGEEDIDLERVKWVCLLVLMNEPEAEQAFAHVEEMVYLSGHSLH